jgi:hypothetical protein
VNPITITIPSSHSSEWNTEYVGVHQIFTAIATRRYLGYGLSGGDLLERLLDASGGYATFISRDRATALLSDFFGCSVIIVVESEAVDAHV